MPGYPGLPNHRTAQSMVPQPSPGFVQQRTQGFPFGGALQQQQQTQQPQTQQHQPNALQQQQQHGQQQLPSLPSTAHSNIPPHLTPNATPSIGGTAPSVSSASEVGLDPNDFPALGSTPATTSASAATNNGAGAAATSYASQAGTGVPVGGSGGVAQAGSNQPRDFTADDFPALGGPIQASQQQSTQSQTPAQDGHPPGLNGVHAEQRGSMVGSLTGALGAQGQGQAQSGQQQPGLLNIGLRGGVHPGLQSETEKQRVRCSHLYFLLFTFRPSSVVSVPVQLTNYFGFGEQNYALKLNAASHAAWNSPNPSSGPGQQQTTGFPPNLQNGSQAQQQAQHQQNHQLNAPPGVPPPSLFPQSQQQPQAQPMGAGAQTSFAGNGNGATSGETPQHPSQGPTAASASAGGPLPQTPAQQVLVSAADRWGLLGLLAMIKSADLDQNLLSVGTDLGTMGLDMQNQGNLYSTFITPWADSSAAHSVEPDFHLPTCYNVQPPPPGPNKAAAFSDETLFFMFYSSPRDALQEVAAQELYNRNWRYHKELRLWLTKESGTSPSQKVPGGEQGTYTFWDPDNWGKERKDMTVLYADLEEKSQPVFAPGPTLQLNTPAQQQVTVAQRGAYQGVGMGAM
ncbi:hypothetical protein EW146_g3510 [Bondarzewia mesenterica]|uniref:NOT2/NOT3/NOT5 C-terminal domain-containing protein n=1 Tax=Bondarzewia mesenterica TaxID=1095465 RepID=A0A4S4M380_9AGAM|nr:hypothetical protein EW146_g3510 [Bondarzewia mesenterica]